LSIIDTFSKRKRRLEHAGTQDVYVYDLIPQELRVQIVYIWRSSLGQWTRSEYLSLTNQYWKHLHQSIARELGRFYLGDGRPNPQVECETFLLREPTTNVLDIVEYSFRLIDGQVRENFDPTGRSAKQPPDEAIAELNGRFAEHGLGYQYADGNILRLDSHFAHAEIVKPALSLLNDADFKGASQEFLRAHEHFRHGRRKEAVAEALKAFESTMKSICSKKKWLAPPNATARPLLDIVFSHGLIPTELKSHFDALRAAMDSGLPTISNRTSRHGQGLEPVSIDDHLVAYALHLAASNIVFLVEAYNALP